MRLEENVYVRMRDGIRISLDINRPDEDERVPALLPMSPYGKETQRFPGGPFSSVESGDTKYFVEHGYAYVLMDSRGSAPSEGQWALASPDEQQDGCEVIEWLAGQPWCNGKVAMVGGSYYGRSLRRICCCPSSRLTPRQCPSGPASTTYLAIRGLQWARSSPLQ